MTVNERGDHAGEVEAIAYVPEPSNELERRRVPRPVPAGWAEIRTVPTGNVAVIPAGVSLEDASALPAADVTALRAVRSFGSIVTARARRRCVRRGTRSGRQRRRGERMVSTLDRLTHDRGLTRGVFAC